MINVGASAQQLFGSKPANFDAPAHHGDEVVRLPATFKVLAENSVTLQAVSGEGGKIHCTQYHPDSPYKYIRKLLLHWAPNYRELFTNQEFQFLLNELVKKERVECSTRTMEFQHWFGMITSGTW